MLSAYWAIASPDLLVRECAARSGDGGSERWDLRAVCGAGHERQGPRGCSGHTGEARKGRVNHVNIVASNSATALRLGYLCVPLGNGLFQATVGSVRQGEECKQRS